MISLGFHATQTLLYFPALVVLVHALLSLQLNFYAFSQAQSLMQQEILILHCFKIALAWGLDYNALIAGLPPPGAFTVESSIWLQCYRLIVAHGKSISLDYSSASKIIDGRAWIYLHNLLYTVYFSSHEVWPLQKITGMPYSLLINKKKVKQGMQLHLE